MVVGAHEQVLIGLDLGTSGLKGVALSSGGRVLASARADYPTHRPVTGASEQDPQDWIAALKAVIADLARGVSPDTWLGIGLSGMIPTLVVTNAFGEPLCPAITWEDARADAQGELLRDTVGAQTIYDITGQWVDGRYLLPMYLRIAPELGSDEVRLFGAKDWILHWLTGHYATDPATATGSGAYNLTTHHYDSSVTDSVLPAGADAIEFAAVVPATTLFELTTSAAHELGLPRVLPIAVGAADAMAALVGLGVHTPGDAVYLAGTSTVIVGIDETPHFDSQHRFLVTPLALGGYGHEMDLLATGSAQAWLAQLLGLESPDDLGDLARSTPADADGLPTMLGYVAPGEQGALWDSTLTGVIEGITLHTSASHLARALLTSITVESARCVSVWEESAPHRGELHVAGRGINQSVLQELADATGRTTHLCGDEHAAHSAVGAAVIVGNALGFEPPAHQHRAQLTTEPRAQAADMWQSLKQRHDELRLRTTP
jgi:gluconokinase/xylulokinase